MLSSAELLLCNSESESDQPSDSVVDTHDAWMQTLFPYVPPPSFAATPGKHFLHPCVSLAIVLKNTRTLQFSSVQTDASNEYSLVKENYFHTAINLLTIFKLLIRTIKYNPNISAIVICFSKNERRCVATFLSSFSGKLDIHFEKVLYKIKNSFDY